MATASVDLDAKYEFEGESVDHTSFFSDMVGGFETENHYHEIKEADFVAGISYALTISGGGNSGTETRTAASNVLVDEVFSQSGNPSVTVTGHDMYGAPLEKNELELELEAIFGGYGENVVVGEGESTSEITNNDEGLSAEGEPPGILGSGFLGGYLGLAETGRILTRPLRWVGVDFTSQDEALNRMWGRLSAPDGTREQTQACGEVANLAVNGAIAVGPAVNGSKYLLGRLVGQRLAGTATTGLAAKNLFFLREGGSAVGWIVDGEVIIGAPNTTHQLAGIACGAIQEGKVVANAYAFSVGKQGGEIWVMGSQNFGGAFGIPIDVAKIVASFFH
jgi:hypothetical protein